MAYRDDDQLKLAVRNFVNDALSDNNLRAEIKESVVREASRDFDKALAKEIRIGKHLIWALFLAIALLLTYFGYSYAVKMSTREGRCEEACSRVESVTSDTCTCVPPSPREPSPGP